jgi:hypothetical protein
VKKFNAIRPAAGKNAEGLATKRHQEARKQKDRDEMMPCYGTHPAGNQKSRYEFLHALFVILCAFLRPIHLPDL